MSLSKCKDGGDCGIGGYCRECPYTTTPPTKSGKGSDASTCSVGSPPVDQWNAHETKLLPGDLVETEWGRAIITEAKTIQGEDSYAVWHLPCWAWKREPWGWSPPTSAWLSLDNLKLISDGPASIIRPN